MTVRCRNDSGDRPDNVDVPVALDHAPPLAGVSLANVRGDHASIPDSCWIAGALTAIAARAPNALTDAIRRAPDGTLGLRYFRLGYPDYDGAWSPGALTFVPHLHPSDWRPEDLAGRGTYRFLEHGVFSLIGRLDGGQTSDVLNLLLGEKYRMVPASPRVLDRIRAELLDPSARALPVLGTRRDAALGLLPEHAYVVRGEATLDGAPALRLEDSVGGATHVVSDEDLLAALAGVSLRDPKIDRGAFGFR